jgi:hypothetical protein
MTLAAAMLAALINPALFWGGLGAVSIPIAIHLLARRRFRRVRWAAMDFLLDAEKHNRRRVRLEELILLALRCLAVFLLGVLAARPFLRPSGIAALLGGAERTERIFLLDDSFSMGYLTDGTSAFDRAKQGLANLIERLRRHSPDDTVTVLRASAPQAPVVTGALLTDEQVEMLLARLEALQPAQQTLPVGACMDGVRAALERDRGIVSAALYVLSDFQRVDWARGGPRGDVAEALAGWTEENRSIRVYLVDVGDDDAANRAVSGITARRRQLVTGVEAPFEVTVGNHTAQDLAQLDLAVTVDGQPLASAVARDLPADTRTPASLALTFPDPGQVTLEVSIPDDGLPIDNTRALVARITDAVRVLVVNGEPAGDAYLDEVALLATALRPEGDVFSGNAVDIIEESQLESIAFAEYDLVILCNLYRASEPVADALHRYVRDGGGLLVFPGDQISDPAGFNATLYRDGAGLLPARLGGVIHARDPGVTLATGDWRHPVVRVFSGDENPFRTRLHFTEYFELQPAPAVAPDPGAPDGAGPTRPAAAVLARFDDPEQWPAIVERDFGAGRVMLFASACDLEWNDWAKDASFVVTVQEAVQHLARSGANARPVRVGEPILLTLDPARYEPVAGVRGPAYPQEPESEVSAVADDAGGLQLRWTDTARAGVYGFVLRQRDGGREIRRVAVTLDPAESDLTPATEAELLPAFGGLPVEYLVGVPALADDADEGRREYWPVILALVVGGLVLEQLLAWRFGRG